MSNVYPVKLSIDYPDRKLDRLTSFFRIFTVIPIMIVISLMMGSSSAWGEHHDAWRWGVGSASGLLFLPTLLMVLFRQKYPRWWFDWNVNITKFATRVFNYFALMTDVYPSTDEEQAVHIEIPYPDAAKDIKPWMPLVKWFLAIPHYIVLAFLMIAVWVVWVITWFAILFTGKYPRSFFDFMAGVFRWSLRVTSYAFILVTDVYPPFSLD
ncbi:MAG: DUF4389 domain-containing protein [Dehalococcoidales bacterium]|nr:DUF4389 domain-containing protein [Dehalococcoidales bacterium]